LQRHYNAFEQLLFLAQRLTARGVVPDGGVFEGDVNFF